MQKSWQHDSFESAYTLLFNAVKIILSNPIAGEAKKGDLAGVLVYKYKHQQQLLLLAYSIDHLNQQLILLGYGTHENFYRDLKRNEAWFV